MHPLNLEIMRQRLIEMILEYSFNYSEEPICRLAHGGLSRFYFNNKQVTLDPEGQCLIGHLVFEKVKNLGIKAIGGLTLGADPIANAVAYTSWLKQKPVQAFVVRKEAKDHGAMSQIEGKISSGDRVVIVDDVITTGSSTLTAIQACLNVGIEVVKVIALVDRQEANGRENILAEVSDVEAIITRGEIMGLYQRKGDK
jgi:orotate phosphoribosyltransferase